MSNVTANQAPLIKAQLYSEYMLEAINEGFLPDGLHRDVADFGDGENIDIPVMGETVLRDYVEDTGVEFDPVDTGQVSLQITEYVSSASYVTDKLKQDAYKAKELESRIPVEHFRVIRERYESDLLAQANKQANGDPNLIAGLAHRWVANSGSTVGVLTLEDIAYAKFGFDEAGIPDEGRILLLPPVGEMTLNQQIGNQAFSDNPQFEGIVNTGFARGRRFVRNIYGFDIWVSTRLPRVTETIDGGPHASEQSVTNGIVAQFLNVLDDQHTPYMGAWRQNPQTEGFRNVTWKRDEYSTTARWGFGLQRPETLSSVLLHPTAYK